MTPNEIGYLIYVWDRCGLRFATKKYSPNTDYTNYLKYYTDEDSNKILIEQIIKNNPNGIIEGNREEN